MSPASGSSAAVAAQSQLTARAGDRPLIFTENLSKEFPAGTAGLLARRALTVKAVQHVNLRIFGGETVGLVGESGSGKSTLGRLIIKLLEPTAGRVVFDEKDLSKLGRSELRNLRREMQIVFQDPYASLNPRMNVRSIVGEGITIHRLARGAEKEARIVELLGMVGLDADALNRYPHEFSGGQRQRIGIARALAVSPRFLCAQLDVAAMSAVDIGAPSRPNALIAISRPHIALSGLYIADQVDALYAFEG